MNLATAVVAVIVILIIGGAAYRVVRTFLGKEPACSCCSKGCKGGSCSLNCTFDEEEKKD